MIWEIREHHIFIIKWKKYKFYLIMKLGTSVNLDLDLLLLFSKDLNLQALQHMNMASREKLWGMRVSIPPA